MGRACEPTWNDGGALRLDHSTYMFALFALFALLVCSLHAEPGAVDMVLTVRDFALPHRDTAFGFWSETELTVHAIAATCVSRVAS